MNENFTGYRLSKGYSPKSIKSQDSYLRHFMRWQRSTQPKGAENLQLLFFLDYLKKEKCSRVHQKNILQAVRIYYDYLIEEGEKESNPAISVRLRNTSSKTKEPPLPAGMLDEIYSWFTGLSLKTERQKQLHKRDGVMLGLLVYQGLDSGDMERLKVKDIQLEKGEIYIPSSRSNASRTLKLEAKQILLIKEYMDNIRPVINPTQEASEQLFTHRKIQDTVSVLASRIKEKYPEVKGSRHIRSSVLMNWLSMYHIRQVQYMAGHRCISSTERYQKENLHDLSEQLQKYHPMK